MKAKLDSQKQLSSYAAKQLRNISRVFSPTKFLLFAFCFLLFPLNVFAQKTNVDTPQNQYKYQQKVLRQEEIEKYERSLLPQSGFMTTEDYEALSKDISNSQRVIPEYKMPKDVKMKYVPQVTYKIVKYNNPPGSPELHLQRNFKFDRQTMGGAVTSPNNDILVYPVVYYYANNQCTAGDLFVIPLDMSLPVVDRILRSNIVKRIPDPIISTPKEISEKFTFRSLTPIDFSPDGTKLVAKEKIGNMNDGIWKTNLWVYDFNTRQAKELCEIRDAIRFYWKNQGVVLDEKRWDITPLGFDVNDPERVIVSAFGYTGKAPKFLGNWSIDCAGERTLLVSLLEADVRVSINGFKLEKSGVVNPVEVLGAEKKADKEVKKKRKADKKEKKKELKAKKAALNKRLREMKHEEAQTLKQYTKNQSSNAVTGVD